MIYPDIDKFSPMDFSPKQVKKKYPEFYDWLLENYTFVDDFREKLYCWYHGITEHPVCKMCGKPTKFKFFASGYSEYCSSRCSSNDPVIKKKVEETCLERYGVTSTNKLPENRRKSRETFKKNYSDNPDKLEELKSRTKKTCKERYGTDTFFESEEFKDKYKKTMQERYGVDNYAKTEEYKEKFKKTNLERYGAEHYMQTKKAKDRVRNTFLERYGVEWATLVQSAVNANGSDSRNNLEFESLLTENIIDHSREFTLKRYRYDFKVGDTLVEINPTATHNSTFGVFGKPPKDKTYHLGKSKFAEENGYRCITVWDWDDLDRVISLLKPRKTVYARECTIEEISQKEANSFLEDNHIQGGCKGQKVCLALVKDSEMLQVMTFGKPRYNKKMQWELYRLCTKSGITVVGGSEKLFKHFTEKHSPESIVSYCDLSKFSGDIYRRLGFTEGKKPQPSKHWVNLATGQHITDNLLRQRGFDQLFKTNYGKGTSNEELMLEHGFVEIYDCGQASYVWKKLE